MLTDLDRSLRGKGADTAAAGGIRASGAGHGGAQAMPLPSPASKRYVKYPPATTPRAKETRKATNITGERSVPAGVRRTVKRLWSVDKLERHGYGRALALASPGRLVSGLSPSGRELPGANSTHRLGLPYGRLDLSCWGGGGRGKGEVSKGRQTLGPKLQTSLRTLV